MQKLASDNFLKKYQPLLEFSIDGSKSVIVIDEDYCVCYFNKRAIEAVKAVFGIDLKLDTRFKLDAKTTSLLSEENANILDADIKGLSFLALSGNSYLLSSKWFLLDDQKFCILKLEEETNVTSDSLEVALFKTIADQSRDAILITGAKLEKPGPFIEYVNDAYLKLSDYQRDEIIGKTPRIMQGPNTSQEVLKDLKAKLIKGESFFGQTYNYKKNGEEFINQWMISPISDEAGKVVKYFAIIRDVTESERAKEDLLENEIKLRSIFESSHNYILMYDEEYKVLEYNTQLAELLFLDYKIKFGKGDAVQGVFPSANAMTFMLEATKSLANGKKLEIEAIDNLFGNDRWYKYSFSPVKAYKNKNVFMLSFKDIDNEKRNAIQIESSERKYRTIIDTLAEGIILQNQKREIIEFNKSALEILGLTSDQMLGRTSYDPRWKAIDANEKPLDGSKHPIVKSLVEGKSTDRFVMAIHKPTGEINWISVNSRPIFGEDGKVEQAIASFNDITEEYRLSKESREANEMLQMAQKIGKIGGWKFDLVKNKIELSEVSYEIHKLKVGTPITVEEAIGFYHPDSQPIIAQAVDTLIQKRKAYDLELKIINNLGQVVWVRTQGVPRIENNKVVEIYGTFQDIDEIKRNRIKQDEFTKLINLSSDLASISTFEGVFEFLNPAWTDTLGYSINHLTRQPFTSFIHPDDLKSTTEIFKKLISDESYTVINFKNRYRTKKGNYRWFSWSAKSDIINRKVYAITTDITHQVEQEERLKRNERFYRKLSHKGFGINLILNLEGAITYAGGYFEKLFDSSNRLIKKELTHFLVDEDKEKFNRLIQQCLERPDTVIADKFKLNVSKKNGKWVEAQLTNLIDDPDINGIVANLHEITDTMEAMSRVIDSEYRYKSLVDKSPMGIVIHQKGITKFINPAAAKIVGNSYSDKLLGRNMLDFVQKSDHSKIKEITQELYASISSETKMNTYTFIKAGGEQINAEVTSILTNFEGEPAIQSTFLDVTDRNEALAAIKESEARYRSLVNKSPMPIVISTNEKITFLNDAAAKILGGAIVDFLEKPVKSIFPRRLKEENSKAILINSHLKGNVSQTIDLILQTKDREEVYVDLIASSIEYKRKSSTQLMFLDVTEKKKLLKEQLKLKNIVTESHEAIITINPKTLEINYANNAALKLIGYSIEEIKKLALKDLRPDDVEDTGQMTQRLNHVKNTNEILEYQGRVKKKGGLISDIQVKVQYLEFDSDGEFVISFTDITEQMLFNKRKELINEINRIIVDKDSSKEALSDIIGLTAKTLYFDYGEVWRIEDDQFIRHGYHQLINKNIKDIAFQNKDVEFKIGEGAIGATFINKELNWITKLNKRELKNYKILVNNGIKSLVVFPLIVDDEVLGLGKLYSTNKKPYDAEVANLLMTIGAQIAQFKKRKNMEISLYNNVKEKETLLQEIHHRVKNNLQTVSSLLYLKSASISDPEVKRFFLESQNRINAITFTHERLLKAKSFTHLDIKDYLDDLVDNILRTHMNEFRTIEVHRDIQSIVLGTDIVMNCGMIINELLINVFDHAFGEKENGNIYITFKKEGDFYYFSVKDDGKGFDIKDDFNESVGVQLVHLFAGQLKADLKFLREKGTQVTLKFK